MYFYMIRKVRKFIVHFTDILKLHQTCISNAFIVMDLKDITRGIWLSAIFDAILDLSKFIGQKRG